jgi:hypothetical protein
MRLRPHNFEKATLNAVVLVWYLLNLDLGSPSEKMHAHPRSHFSNLTNSDPVCFPLIHITTYYKFCAKIYIL